MQTVIIEGLAQYALTLVTVAAKSRHILEVNAQQHSKALSVFGRQPISVRRLERTKSTGLQVEIFTGGLVFQIRIKAQVTGKFNQKYQVKICSTLAAKIIPQIVPENRTRPD